MTPRPVEMVAETLPSSVSRLRRFARQACIDAGVDVDCDAVALLVSELATNALLHGGGVVRLRIHTSEVGVRIEVLDESPDLPTRREASPDDEGGRGMALVEAMSSAWGADETADGKTVWFELAAS